MRLLLVAALLLSASLSAQTRPAAAPARPAQLGLCVACHGADGVSRTPGTPHIGGQDEAYLRKSLHDYRAKRRNVAPMTAIANALQARDIEALAAWYARQPGFRAKP